MIEMRRWSEPLNIFRWQTPWGKLIASPDHGVMALAIFEGPMGSVHVVGSGPHRAAIVAGPLPTLSIYLDALPTTGAVPATHAEPFQYACWVSAVATY